MGKDVQLNSPEWIDLIFEKKNKAYGAYVLRETSWKTHITAIAAMIGFTVIVSLLPLLIETVKNARKDYLGGVNATVELTTVEQKVPEENKIKQEAEPVEPPPPLKSSIKFTPPVITDDDDVRDDEQMLSQDKLNESKITVSVANIEGTDEINGMDIAELEQHKVIVAEEQPFVAVEQMPSFPGGEKALRLFIAENMRYPALLQENNVQGRVIVRFVVGSSGKVDKVEVLQGFDRLADAEAIRVVKLLPKFTPGRHNGRAVPVWYTVPIIFKLQ
ncbi:cell envelope biogenesis protein TonB [Bacteroidia bacterium]|nr:cell envelope biogenesis protein TonB [Bacteroidia bacterium]